MKFFHRTLYVLVIIFLGIVVYRVRTINIKKDYLKNEGIKYLETNEMDRYMEIYAEAENLDSYIKEPVYSAISKDEVFPFSFKIYHAKTKFKTNNNILLFYFDDRNIDNLKEKIKYEELAYNRDYYENNNELIIIRINIYMDDNQLPTTNFYYTSLDKRTALAIIGFSEVDDTIKYHHYQMTTENDKKPTIRAAERIDKIEIVIEDYTNNDFKEPIRTKIASITTDNNQSNGIDYLTKTDDILKSNNFNGLVTMFDKSKVYENNNDLIYVTTQDFFKDQKSKVYISLLIYSAIVSIITYLIYFLKPTINYFKNKKLQK